MKNIKRKILLSGLPAFLCALAIMLCVAPFMHTVPAANAEPVAETFAGGNLFLEKNAAPTASVAAGEYAGPQRVTLSTAKTGAKIYYTLDGSVPTAESAEYTEAVTVGQDGVQKEILLRAVAELNGAYSEISDYTYRIDCDYAAGAKLVNVEDSENIEDGDVTVEACNQNYSSCTGGIGWDVILSYINQGHAFGTFAIYIKQETVAQGRPYFLIDLGKEATFSQIIVTDYYAGSFQGLIIEASLQKDGEYVEIYKKEEVDSVSGDKTNGFKKTIDFAEAKTARFLKILYATDASDLANNYSYYGKVEVRNAAKTEYTPVTSALYIKCNEDDPHVIQRVANATAEEVIAQIKSEIGETAKFTDSADNEHTLDLNWVLDPAYDAAQDENFYAYGFIADSAMPANMTDLYKAAVRVRVAPPIGAEMDYAEGNVILHDIKPVATLTGDAETMGDGEYLTPGQVELSCELEGAKIYYTLDGSVPTVDSTEYTQAITLGQENANNENKEYLLRAVAELNGVYSEILDFAYRVYNGVDLIMNTTITLGNNTGRKSWTGGAGHPANINEYLAAGKPAAYNLYIQGDASHRPYYLFDFGEEVSIGWLRFSAAVASGILGDFYDVQIDISSDGSSFENIFKKDGKFGPQKVEGGAAMYEVRLQEAKSARYIRYYGALEPNCSDTWTELGALEVHGGYDSVTPETYIKPLDEVKTLEVEKDATKDDVLSVIKQQFGTTAEFTDSKNVKHNYNIIYALEEDYDSEYGGVFYAYGMIAPSELDGICNIYNAAVCVRVSVPTRPNPTKINELLADYNDFDYAPWTKRSGNVLKAALDAAKDLSDRIKADRDADIAQKAIDDAEKAINDAFAALARLGEKTTLTAKLTEANGKNESEYTTASFAVLTAKKNEAQTVAQDTDASESEVAAALAELEEAIAGLQKRANKAALEQAYASASALKQADYVSATFAALAQKLNAADAVIKNTDASQTEAEIALAELNAAVAALVLRGDRVALTAKITAAQANKATDFTVGSFAALEDALAEAAELTADEDASKFEVDAAIADIDEKIAELVSVKEIKETIVAAQAKKAEDYTRASFAILTESLAEADSVVENPDAAKSDVTAAQTALDSAIKALVKLGDKTALRAAVANVKLESEYTAISYLGYSVALDYANRVIADRDATEADVADAIAKLQAAETALVKASETPGITPGGDDDNKPIESGKKKKCGSSAAAVGLPAAMLMLAAACAALSIRKKED